ncbi:MAG: DNA translocase FtsK 4TM domain-containing protein [Candidatus Paceibacterota bacterium]|jgi:S-DNA-T family DNA segregation ATPase FtsK/SpoIIIE
MKKKKFDKSKPSRKLEVEEIKEPMFSEEVFSTAIAILFFILALFFIMASFGKAGMAGNAIYSALTKLLGVGFFLLPILFLLLSVSFMRTVRPNLATRSLIGSFLFVFSGLGLLSLSPGEDTGGFLGNIFSTPLVKLFDIPFSVLFLVALLIISVIVLFDTAPRGEHFAFLKKLAFWRKKEDVPYVSETSADATKDDPKNVSPAPDAASVNPPPDDKKEGDEEKEKKGIFGFVKKKDEEDILEERFERLRNSITTKEFNPPPLSLLERDKGKPGVGDMKANSNIIRRTLQQFGIIVEMDEICIGPSVTRYALKPAEGVKLSRIVGLQSELALNLAAHPIRIEAPIPGTSLVGIEVPNSTKTTVGLGSLLSSQEFIQSEHPLFISLGKSISGKTHFGNLTKMPHLLVAGATGSGKSVTVHTMITSLLYRNPPENLRFIMIDPKRVELTMYNGIPHLITPVITDAKKTLAALRWAAREMDRRYDVLEAEKCRDIKSYHAKIKDELEKIAEKERETAAKYRGKETEENDDENAPANEANDSVKIPERMPYIVIVVDELADLMQTFPRELESAIVRLAQMSRAVGIHLILSTQRPSVNIITGLIKANIPCRVALQVTSQIDSRTILDTGGAEKLLGAGDMLYLSGDMPKPIRLQSAYVTEAELKKVVKYIVDEYRDIPPEYINMVDVPGRDAIFTSNLEDEKDSVDDELYEKAKAEVISSRQASTSYLQRKLGVGYSRAAKLIDVMEEQGVIGPKNGSKAREVLIKSMEMEADALLEKAGEGDDDIDE